VAALAERSTTTRTPSVTINTATGEVIEGDS
jgi:hypothetical protein